MEISQTTHLAQKLDQARYHREEIAPLTREIPEISLEQAYRIQDLGIEARLGQGEKVVGYKMGLTSEAKRAQMNLTAAIYGVLTDKMQIRSEHFSLGQSIHPKIEPEIAFVTNKPLRGKVGFDELLGSLSGMFPSFEIIDSRFRDFKYFSLPDVVADNCSSSFFVLGKSGLSSAQISRLDFSKVHITFDTSSLDPLSQSQITHQERAQATEVSGNPLNSLMQLIELLDQRGLALPAGSIILTGSATRAIELKAGMEAKLRVADESNTFDLTMNLLVET